MHVTSSLTSKKYSGQISKTSEVKAKKELWSFVIEPKYIDFNDENGFAAAKEKLRQLGDEFSLIEPIKKYGKSVAETLNNHCNSARLFKNRQAKSIDCEGKFDMEQEQFDFTDLLSNHETLDGFNQRAMVCFPIFLI